MQRVPEMPFFMRWYVKTLPWPGTGPMIPVWLDRVEHLLPKRWIDWVLENENHSRAARVIGYIWMFVYMGWRYTSIGLFMAWHGFCLGLERIGLGWLWQHSKFKFHGQTVRRPKEFRSRIERDEFDFIGSILVDPWSPNILDHSLYEDRRGAPLSGTEGKTRRKILEYFLNTGVLIERFALAMPFFDPHSEDDVIYGGAQKYWVDWDENGDPLEGRGTWDDRWSDEDTVDLKKYSVNFLTVEQKQALVGRLYAKRKLFWDLGPLDPNDERDRGILEQFERRRKVPKYVIQSDDFMRILYRPRAVLTEQSRAKYRALCEVQKRKKAEERAAEERNMKELEEGVEREAAEKNNEPK